jgi:Tol biopolymer transport system component
MLALLPLLLWTGPEVTLLGGPSRDGRVMSNVQAPSRELVLFDFAAKTVKRVAPANGGEFAYFSIVSADGKQVAYAWKNADGFYELRVDGRTVYRNEEAGFVQPCAWTPDGKAVLTLLFRKDNTSQIAMVPLAGGLPRVLKSLAWVYPKRMDLSRDGQWIVYDSLVGQERKLYVLAADGSGERPVGEGVFPLWREDGQRVVYALGDELWELTVASGERRKLRDGMGRFLPLGITAGDALIYGVRAGGTEVYYGKRQRASLRFPDRNSAPGWSADGKWLAYVSRRGEENFGEESRVLVVREVDSTVEREIDPGLAIVDAPVWSSDAKRLLVRGADRQGRVGVFVVEAASGKVTPVEREAGLEPALFRAAWGKEDTIWVQRGTELRNGERLLQNVRSFAVRGGRLAVLYSNGKLEVDGQERGSSDAKEIVWRGDKLVGGGAYDFSGEREAWTESTAHNEIWQWELPR